MYETFFGLTRRPFASAPDPALFVPVETARRSLAELVECVAAGNGIAVLTAPAGTGKTLACRRLLAELPDRFAGVFLTSGRFPDARSLLQAVLYEMGHPYLRMDEQELRLELRSAVRALHSEGRRLVVVIDEAHLLDARLLEEVRAATNLVEDGESLVRFVLSGEVQLEELLAHPGLESLNQRIACQATLEPLTRRESAEYICERLEAAGADAATVFAPDALELICHASDGLPRCLNQLCDHSLLLAYVAEERPVSVQTVREAVDDLRQLPLHWNEPPSLDAAAARDAHTASLASEEPPVDPIATDDWEAEMEAIEVGGPDPDSGQPGPDGPAADTDEPTPDTDRPAWSEVPMSVEWEEIELGAEPAIPEPEDEHTAESIVESAAPCAVVLEPGTVEGESCEWAAVESCEAPPDAVHDAAEACQPSAMGNQPPQASAGHDSGCFEEVLVIDRYAFLDAGLPVPEEPDAAQSGMMEGPASIETTASHHPAVHSQPSEPRDARPDERPDKSDGSRPDRTIDRILPMLEEALATDGSSADVELHPSITLADAEPAGHGGSPSEAACEEDLNDIEAQIGAAVMEACLEVQSALAEEMALGGHASESALEPMMPGAAEFIDDEPAAAADLHAVAAASPHRGAEPADEPVPTAASASTIAPAALSAGGPRPPRRRPYEQLFSQLRRRHRPQA